MAKSKAALAARFYGTSAPAETDEQLDFAGEPFDPDDPFHSAGAELPDRTLAPDALVAPDPPDDADVAEAETAEEPEGKADPDEDPDDVVDEGGFTRRERRWAVRHLETALNGMEAVRLTDTQLLELLSAELETMRSNDNG